MEQNPPLLSMLPTSCAFIDRFHHELERGNGQIAVGVFLSLVETCLVMLIPSVREVAFGVIKDTFGFMGGEVFEDADDYLSFIEKRKGCINDRG